MPPKLYPGDLAPVGEEWGAPLSLLGDIRPEDDEDWGDDTGDVDTDVPVDATLLLVRTLLCHPVSAMWW